MYQWMLIPSMPVAVSLKRWFESNHQYGSVCSRVQLENGSGNHLKMGPQDIKPFIQFWSLKTDVLWRQFIVKTYTRDVSGFDHPIHVKRDETSQGVVTTAGIAQLIRASPFQGESCGFESHYPLWVGFCSFYRYL